METFFSLQREIMLATEAYCTSHNIPIKRAFAHDELQSALAAIREIESAKLKVPTRAQIDAAMMEIIK